ncbi:MAG: hypothetical protein AB7P52_17625 [Alphaproteobacteria bacterium]
MSGGENERRALLERAIDAGMDPETALDWSIRAWGFVADGVEITEIDGRAPVKSESRTAPPPAEPAEEADEGTEEPEGEEEEPAADAIDAESGKRTRRLWDAEDTERLRVMWRDNVPVHKIAHELNRKPTSVLSRANYLNLPARRAG